MSQVTDEDLAAAEERIAKKREQIAQTKVTYAEHLDTVAREQRAAQLALEEKRLDAELAAAKDSAKITSVRAGAPSLDDTVSEMQLRVAEAENVVATTPTAASAKDKGNK